MSAPGEGLDKDGLNARQRLFALEYLIDLNATEAAVRAGYSRSGASSQGAALLKEPAVQSFLRFQLGKREKKLELSAERVLSELTKLGYSDIRDMFDDDGNLRNMKSLDDNVAAAVASVKIKERGKANGETEVEKEIRLWDKVKSLELLGKHLRLFTDLIEAKVEAMSDEEAAARMSQIYAEAKKRQEAALPPAPPPTVDVEATPVRGDSE